MALTCGFTGFQRHSTTPRSLSQGGSAGSNPVGGTDPKRGPDQQKRWEGPFFVSEAIPPRAVVLHAASRPEAQQLAIYIGWLLNGVRGGLIAGSLFVLPGMLALLGLSALYVGAGDTTIVTAVLPASWSASAPESSTCSRPDRTALHGAVMWPP